MLSVHLIRFPSILSKSTVHFWSLSCFYTLLYCFSCGAIIFQYFLSFYHIYFNQFFDPSISQWWIRIGFQLQLFQIILDDVQCLIIMIFHVHIYLICSVIQKAILELVNKSGIFSQNTLIIKDSLARSIKLRYGSIIENFM